MAPRKAAETRKRRSPGTGTIRFRKGRTQPYEACLPIEGRAARYESFQSYEDAAAFLDQLVTDRDTGARDIAGGSMLVVSYLPMWLELRKGHVAPKTWVGYKYYCEYACGEGGIGKMRMDKVDYLLAQRMVNKLASDGFKNTAQLKAVMYQAFDYASDRLGYIKKNPFRKVKVPLIEHREAKALTKEERARVLDLATLDDVRPLSRQKDAPPPLAPFWHLCSRLAFRRGETLSLKWSAINFDKATVTIGTTRGRLGADHIEGKTKGKKVRVAPLLPDIAELLKAFKVNQMKAALANGWRWQQTGYVFVDNKTGSPLTVDVVVHRWERLKKAAKVDCTIHDLRHTAIYLLALDGVPQNVAMALAGHKTEAMAELYANHASVEDVRRALG